MRVERKEAEPAPRESPFRDRGEQQAAPCIGFQTYLTNNIERGKPKPTPNKLLAFHQPLRASVFQQASSTINEVGAITRTISISS